MPSVRQRCSVFSEQLQRHASCSVDEALASRAYEDLVLHVQSATGRLHPGTAIQATVAEEREGAEDPELMVDVAATLDQMVHLVKELLVEELVVFMILMVILLLLAQVVVVVALLTIHLQLLVFLVKMV